MILFISCLVVLLQSSESCCMFWVAFICSGELVVHTVLELNLSSSTVLVVIIWLYAHVIDFLLLNISSRSLSKLALFPSVYLV